jgi:signal transduction histidine kinase
LREKQSSTAIGLYRQTEGLGPLLGAFAPRESRVSQAKETRPYVVEARSAPSDDGGAAEAKNFPGDGLLHDARNLVSAIGLYCDLLSMPGVLKPEHRKYSDELRLLGTRSEEMIEHLMESLAARENGCGLDSAGLLQGPDAAHGEIARAAGEPGYRAGTVGLRSIVERCSGLLSRVANGRAIEVVCGPAADVPIRIAEESVERILVNLVRNGSAALGEENAAIRISVGPLEVAVGEARPWPFARVRLVVEDAGCGMESRQLEALLSGRGPASRGNHGIGFRVVRELVSASNGQLRAASAPGIGTRIQIEWPVAELAASGRGHGGMMRDRTACSVEDRAVARAIARSGSDSGSGGMTREERRGAN